MVFGMSNSGGEQSAEVSDTNWQWFWWVGGVRSCVRISYMLPFGQDDPARKFERSLLLFDGLTGSYLSTL